MTDIWVVELLYIHGDGNDCEVVAICTSEEKAIELVEQRVQIDEWFRYPPPHETILSNRKQMDLRDGLRWIIYKLETNTFYEPYFLEWFD